MDFVHDHKLDGRPLRLLTRSMLTQVAQRTSPLK
jgi:hypothetical protein